MRGPVVARLLEVEHVVALNTELVLVVAMHSDDSVPSISIVSLSELTVAIEPLLIQYPNEAALLLTPQAASIR